MMLPNATMMVFSPKKVKSKLYNGDAGIYPEKIVSAKNILPHNTVVSRISMIREKRLFDPKIFVSIVNFMNYFKSAPISFLKTLPSKLILSAFWNDSSRALFISVCMEVTAKTRPPLVTILLFFKVVPA